VDVQRITDSAVWYADVSIECAECGQQMQFHGFPVGLSPAEPMVDLTGAVARLPFRPYDEEETRRRFLEDGPGYRVRVLAEAGR
jgi:hypothetical protein